MSFNLELALAQWKQSLMKSGNFEDGDLAELEDHFRMTLEEHIKNGLSEMDAFDKILKEHYADLQEISSQFHEKRQVSRLASALLLNYFKVGYRTFGRHRMYFMINLFGLVLGLTSILSIILYLNHELNFDTFNTQKPLKAFNPAPGKNPQPRIPKP